MHTVPEVSRFNRLPLWSIDATIQLHQLRHARRSQTPTDRALRQVPHGGDQSPRRRGQEFLADLHDATLLNVEGQHRLQTTCRRTKSSSPSRSSSPIPARYWSRCRKWRRGMLHPLTQEGFVAWAEDRVKAEPIVDGKPNSVELELAGVLHQRMVEAMYDEKIQRLAGLAERHPLVRPARLRRIVARGTAEPVAGRLHRSMPTSRSTRSKTLSNRTIETGRNGEGRRIIVPRRFLLYISSRSPGLMPAAIRTA